MGKMTKGLMDLMNLGPNDVEVFKYRFIKAHHPSLIYSVGVCSCTVAFAASYLCYMAIRKPDFTLRKDHLQAGYLPYLEVKSNQQTQFYHPSKKEGHPQEMLDLSREVNQAYVK